LVPGITFTDGAKYVADDAGAYWLLDEIALAQRYEKKVSGEEFQVWKLTVNADSTASSSARTAIVRPSTARQFRSLIFRPRASRSGSQTM
jgi:hypothetical protein